MNRLIAPALATVCGICTAYAAFAPELQKQAAEREGQNVQTYKAQHQGAIPPTNAEHHEVPTIDNDASIGAAVKERIQHVKHELKTEVAPKKAWWGLSIFGASQGGSQSPNEANEKKP